MLFLKRDEVKNYSNLPPFIITDDNQYYGIFIKKRNKLKNLGTLVSLPQNYLPAEFRKNYQFVEDVIKFMNTVRSKSVYIKVYKKDSYLYFDGIIFKKHLTRFLHSKEIGIIPDTNNIKNYSPEKFKELSKIFLSLIPKEILKLLPKYGIIHIESKEKIPFELLLNKYDVIIKNIVGFNKKYYTKNYINKVSLISNGWDNRFSFTKSETLEIFNKIKDNFITEFTSTPMTQEEIIKTINENDVILISSHSDKTGIDLGNTKLNTSTINSITTPPKLVFLNLCYSEEIEKISKNLLNIGVNNVIYPYLKIPDSSQTKYFITTFFETLSKSYDIDLSFYIATKASKTKNHYNYLLYKFCV